MTLADSIRRELLAHATGMVEALRANPPDPARFLRHKNGLDTVFSKAFVLAMGREPVIETP